MINKFNRHKKYKMLFTHFLEVFIKIVKDNNIEQALRVLKRKLQRDGFFKNKTKKYLRETIREEKKNSTRKH